MTHKLLSRAGGYIDSPHRTDDYGELAVKERPIYENALAARALARLYFFTGDLSWHEDASSTLSTLMPEYQKFAHLAAQYALAADLVVNYPVEMIVVGDLDSKATRALHDRCLRLMIPRKTVQLLDPDRDADLLHAKGYSPSATPVVYICANAECAPPIHSVEDLMDAVEGFAKAHLVS